MDPTKILVQGHSFISRLKDFINANQDNYSLSLNLDPNEFLFTYSGKPGGRVAHLYSDVCLASCTPNIVVLQIGSYDLCNSNISPEEVASAIIQYIEYLSNVIHVQHVIVMQILHRLPPSVPVRYFVDIPLFNQKVDETNYILRQYISGNRHFVTSGKHKGLYEQAALQQALSPDGVHLNEDGYCKYFRNIRAAIIAVYNTL